VDTHEQIDHLVKTVNASDRKCVPVYVGTDTALFYPGQDVSEDKTNDKRPYIVHFHGTFIPIHGTDVIIAAAKILEGENIVFNIVGTGQTYERDKKRMTELGLRNINMIPVRGYEKLRSFIIQADLCLGLFGTAKRLDRVIANKVYEYAACKKPIVTAESTSIRSCFGEAIRMCKQNDPIALADEILYLKNNPNVSSAMAQRAYDIFMDNYTPEIIARRLLDELYKKGIIT
jgi:glycosyltransferase involved in cell wall biosynthesis